MYSSPVYFLSVNNLTVARYAAAMMVDYIGFCFDPGDEKFITVAKAREIMGWLSGVQYVGEFRHKPLDEVLAIALELNLPLVLLRDAVITEIPDGLPFKTITVFPNETGTYCMKDDVITDANGNIMALAFDTGKEDETGVVDFSEVNEALEKLEI